MRNVIGLLNCYTSPELGELTSSRPLASTSFLGRFAFMDFALSNFCNSEIDTVGVLVKNHQRSILKHMGNSMSWVENTKIGRITIFYNEKGILNPAYNTDINNIKENDWVLYDSDASYVVLASPEVIADIDLRPILEEHIARGEDITGVYKQVDLTKKSKDFLVLEVQDGYVTGFHKNDRGEKKGYASLLYTIINRTVLADIIARSARMSYSYGINEIIRELVNQGVYKMHGHEHHGFARRLSSFRDYVDFSFELLDHNLANKLFKPDWPIFTATHDTPPALYGQKAKVSDSFVANGCVIEGEVSHSIICRNVTIGKGVKIHDSIILSEVSIGDYASLSHVVVDKYGVITAKHTIAGDKENYIYLKQGAII